MSSNETKHEEFLKLTPEEWALLREVGRKLRPHADRLAEQRIALLERAAEVAPAFQLQEDWRNNVRRTTREFVETLGDEKVWEKYLERGQALVEKFSPLGTPGFVSMMTAIAISHTTVQSLAAELYSGDSQTQIRVLRALNKFFYNELEKVGEIFIAHREQLIAEQKERIIAAQAEVLRELSVPIVPVMENIIVMPLVGTIDARRSQQIMEALLDGIAQHQAQIVIIDITGVPMVDTSVANALVQATQAAALLGSQCILVGITPEVAQTMVELGVEMGEIITRGNLQAGVEYALGVLGRAITETRKRPVPKQKRSGPLWRAQAARLSAQSRRRK